MNLSPITGSFIYEDKGSLQIHLYLHKNGNFFFNLIFIKIFESISISYAHEICCTIVLATKKQDSIKYFNKNIPFTKGQT